MADTISTLDTLNFPGQINILRCDLISHSGRSVDISGILGEMSLYEDMFSNTMSGHVFLEDALDLVNTLPIVGQEMLLVELQTPSFKKIIKKRFYIYKLEHRILNARSSQYMLQFCSIELINSANSKVSRAFSGKIHDTIKQLFCQAPHGDDRYIASQEQLYYEPTRNSLEFIAPYWTPLQTINWLCEKALNERGAANYLFYETNQGFEFYSLDNLLHNGAVAKYSYGDVGSRTVSPDEDFEKTFGIVESVETDVGFDYLRSLSSGMYGSVLYTFDTTSKTMSRTIYDYLKDFNENFHAEAYPLNAEDLYYKKQASMYHLLKNNHVHGNNQPITYSSFYQRRNSLLAQLQAFRFNINVFGRTDIRVGDIVEFEMMSKKEIGSEEIDDTKKSMARDFSGRCIITAIRHSITQGVHKMNMEISSESFSEKVKD